MIHLFLALTLAAAGSPPPLPANCAPAAGFTGTICKPATAGKHPAIILLGGSEGGDIMRYTAPQFAGAGYVAASVAYFGAPGLPQALENIPVETVGNAITLIAARPDVDPNRIAIMGISKGGELALLTASLYPQIHAVVAGVPSPFGWQGIPRGIGAVTSAWTFGGKPVPYIPYSGVVGTAFTTAYTAHTPLELRPGYEASLDENKAQIATATFHLENIKGPVFFIAAGDDGVWNSERQSQMGLAYLQAHNHPYADRIEVYPGAGHAFFFATANRPMTTAPMGPFTLKLGGTPKANVAAATQVWPKIRRFLSETFSKPVSTQ